MGNNYPNSAQIIIKRGESEHSYYRAATRLLLKSKAPAAVSISLRWRGIDLFPGRARTITI